MLEFVEFFGSIMLKVGSVVIVGLGVNVCIVINFVFINGLQEIWISGVGSFVGLFYWGLFNLSEYLELQCFSLVDIFVYFLVDDV